MLLLEPPQKAVAEVVPQSSFCSANGYELRAEQKIWRTQSQKKIIGSTVSYCAVYREGKFLKYLLRPEVDRVWAIKPLGKLSITWGKIKR